MKRILLALIVSMFCFMGISQADIFNPIGSSSGPQKTSLTNPQLTPAEYNVVLTDVTNIINYLGVKEGYAYNFKLRQGVNTVGATIVTYAPLNLSADLEMLNADGVAGVLAWNVGQYLPVQNAPIMKYFSYLYINAGYGWEENGSGNKFVSAPVIGAEFKFSF